MANVVFDEESARRIAAAVKWVEQYSLDETNDPESEDDPAADSAARTVIRGTFSGEWPKGSAKDVNYTPDNGSSSTQSATNYFADVGSDNATPCVIMQAGSEWVLVNAEPVVRVASNLAQITASGNVTVLTVPQNSTETTNLTLVSNLTDTPVTLIESVSSNGTIDYVSNITSVGCATTVSNLSSSSEVVTNVACVDNELVITTAPLSSLLTVSKQSLTLGTFAKVTSKSTALAELLDIVSTSVGASNLASIEYANVTLPANTTTANLTLESFANLTSLNLSHYGPE